ncbi:hypothetical protein U1Q18_041385 [Sarracenia purpurea var. burkii]
MGDLMSDDPNVLSRSISDTPPTHYMVTIQLFSLLTANNIDRYESGVFEAGGYKWKIVIYPKGKGSGVGTHISLFLALAEPTALPPNSKIFAEFRLRLVDQIYGRDYSAKANYWFSASRQQWGWNRFLTLTYFNTPNIGLLVRDICMVEAEVTIHGVATPTT